MRVFFLFIICIVMTGSVTLFTSIKPVNAKEALKDHYTNGASIGADIATSLNKSDQLIINSNYTSLGGHASYRIALIRPLFIDLGAFLSKLVGKNHYQNLKPKSKYQYGATLGLGVNLTPDVRAYGFIGPSKIRAGLLNGTNTDKGYIYGAVVEFSLTPKSSFGIRYSRSHLKGSSGNFVTNALGLRMSFHF